MIRFHFIVFFVFSYTFFFLFTTILSFFFYCFFLTYLIFFFFFFFFSSRRRHTRFDCDWSSDVCSSDLATGGRDPRLGRDQARHRHQLRRHLRPRIRRRRRRALRGSQPVAHQPFGDRKSVV